MNTIIQQENVDEAEQPSKRKPNNMQIKKLQKIQNNRFLNQTIYQLFALGRYQQCLQTIQKCQPDQYKLYMKSLIFKHQFKLQKSLSLLTECESMNKLNFNYLKNIAKNFYLLGKYKSSLEVAKEAYKLNVSDYQIFYIFAKIAAAMKDIDGAISNLGRALTKQPNQESFIFLAKLLIDKGKHRQASQELKKALLISPQNDQIHQLLGQIQMKLGHKSDAMKYHQQAIQINPNKYQSLFCVAVLKEAQNQIQEALQLYTDAYKITQNSALFWNNLASVMLKKNKDIAAYCCLKKALYLDPFRYDIHTNLGLILFKVKKFVTAQLHFRSALKLKKDPQTFNLLALSLAQVGDLANAQKCFEQIQKIEGVDKDKNTKMKYMINYMCLLLKKGDKQKCKKVYQRYEDIRLQDGEMSQKFKEIKSYL